MKLFRQIILLALTLLVLVSSTGISVGMHLCGGELRDVSLFGSKSDCPMEQQQKEKLPPCHQVPADGTSSDCCDDHTFLLQSDNLTSDTKAQLLTKQHDIKFIAAISAVILQLFEQQVALNPTYALYTSPPTGTRHPGAGAVLPDLISAFSISACPSPPGRAKAFAVFLAAILPSIQSEKAC